VLELLLCFACHLQLALTEKYDDNVIVKVGKCSVEAESFLTLESGKMASDMVGFPAVVLSPSEFVLVVMLSLVLHYQAVEAFLGLVRRHPLNTKDTAVIENTYRYQQVLWPLTHCPCLWKSVLLI
jgi:hypothetical protein